MRLRSSVSIGLGVPTRDRSLGNPCICLDHELLLASHAALDRRVARKYSQGIHIGCAPIKIYDVGSDQVSAEYIGGLASLVLGFSCRAVWFTLLEATILRPFGGPKHGAVGTRLSKHIEPGAIECMFAKQILR